MINYKDIKENTSMDFRKKVYRVEGYIEAHNLEEAYSYFNHLNKKECMIMLWEAE